MRYDIEKAASDMFTDYLKALCSTQAGQVMDPNGCQIVTFYDPMSIDDADRLTVMVPDSETDAPDPGCFSATVDIGLKTLWTQPTVKDDFCKHFARLNDVRDKLILQPADILTRISPYIPPGIELNRIQPRKKFSTHIAESTAAKWIYSGTTFIINGYFIEG